MNKMYFTTEAQATTDEYDIMVQTVDAFIPTLKGYKILVAKPLKCNSAPLVLLYYKLCFYRLAGYEYTDVVAFVDDFRWRREMTSQEALDYLEVCLWCMQLPTKINLSDTFYSEITCSSDY